MLDGRAEHRQPLREPEDANWAAPFLFGRWAWDGYLFGAALNGPGISLIDATYDYGFGRLRQAAAGHPRRLPDPVLQHRLQRRLRRVGPGQPNHRDQGILDYEFMIENSQSGPYSWWESQQSPNPGSPWTGTHPESGKGASPHAWGMANANLVLLDSLVAQRADGGLIVGRGVPGLGAAGRPSSWPISRPRAGSTWA